MIAAGEEIALDQFNRPTAFFASLVHQGCTRNEYHEYDIEDSGSGRGCMFFSLGCRGPQTVAPCNTELWNGHSSKTRAGVPCFRLHFTELPARRRSVQHAAHRGYSEFLPLGVVRASTWPTEPRPRRCAGTRGQPGDGAVSRVTVDIDLNRVEGDLEFQLDLEDGIVVDARCIGTLYRGFEQIPDRASAERFACDHAARLRHLRDGASLCRNPCTGQIAGIEPSAHAVHIRNLCLMAETVQSDLRQTFLFFTPISATRSMAAMPWLQRSATPLPN